MHDLNGKSVLITGGARGIGRGLCQYLLEQGMRVVFMDHDAQAGEGAGTALSHLGELHFVQADTADEQSVRTAVSLAVEHLGGLDGVVNNAAIADPESGPPEALALEQWQRVLEVNLTGYFLVAKHAIAHLRARRGALVNIASTRALQSEPHTEAYAAAKGGVLALTHALAMSLGPEVRVNCISPGWIDVSQFQGNARRTAPDLRPVDHGQHPTGRVGQPRDVAGMAAFLLSEHSGFVTGQNFVVDGGMTRKMIYAD